MSARTKVVLEEEKKAAHEWTEGLIFGASINAFCGAIVASLGLAAQPGNRVIAVPLVGVFWGATLLCLLALWRARRTIRRWRDQERERLALAEAERIGKEGVK